MGVDITKIEINTVNGLVTVFVGSETDDGITTINCRYDELFPYYFFQLKDHGTFGDLFEVFYTEETNIITIKKSIVPL